MLEPRIVRLGIISDLHYMRHKKEEVCRPAVASAGVHADPMESLIRLMEASKSSLARPDGTIVDYLVCPGDIGNRADAAAFNEGWLRLKRLKEALGARHIVASTGNHEVSSRASVSHDTAGQVELTMDPLDILQRHADYPSSLLSPTDERWTYWGRGYATTTHQDTAFLILNSSHYHITTRSNEYERGRVGEVALQELAADLQRLVSASEERLYVAILHHHPITHQDLDISLGKIEMDNGALLLQALERTNVTWLIVHGHKHHPRLLLAQGGRARPVVFAAGSFGAQLDGSLATMSRNQFYVIEADVTRQHPFPKAAGHIRAWSWGGLEWEPSTRVNQGIPDGCGYRVPEIQLDDLMKTIKGHLQRCTNEFLTFREILKEIPELRYLLPADWEVLRRAMIAVGIKSTWGEKEWFPTDLSL